LRSLLHFYSRLAVPVYRYRFLLWAISVAAAGFFGVSLFASAASETAPLGSLLVFMWSLLLLALGYCFVKPVPQVDPEAGFMARLASRIKRALLWVVALLATALCLYIVYLSVRAAGLIIGE